MLVLTIAANFVDQCLYRNLIALISLLAHLVIMLTLLNVVTWLHTAYTINEGLAYKGKIEYQ